MCKRCYVSLVLTRKRRLCDINEGDAGILGSQHCKSGLPVPSRAVKQNAGWIGESSRGTVVLDPISQMPSIIFLDFVEDRFETCYVMVEQLLLCYRPWVLSKVEHIACRRSPAQMSAIYENERMRPSYCPGASS